MIKDDHHYEVTVTLKNRHHFKNYVILVRIQNFISTKSATKLKHETFEQDFSKTFDISSKR